MRKVLTIIIMHCVVAVILTSCGASKDENIVPSQEDSDKKTTRDEEKKDGAQPQVNFPQNENRPSDKKPAKKDDEKEQIEVGSSSKKLPSPSVKLTSSNSKTTYELTPAHASCKFTGKRKEDSKLTVRIAAAVSNEEKNKDVQISYEINLEAFSDNVSTLRFIRNSSKEIEGKKFHTQDKAPVSEFYFHEDHINSKTKETISAHTIQKKSDKEDATCTASLEHIYLGYYPDLLKGHYVNKAALRLNFSCNTITFSGIKRPLKGKFEDDRIEGEIFCIHDVDIVYETPE